MNTEVIDLLKRARERISAPERWTKGGYAKDAKGFSVAPDAPEAVCWCASGAVKAESPDGDELYDIRGALSLHISGITNGIPRFNDAPSTTHADILALFDRTIAELEAAP